MQSDWFDIHLITTVLEGCSNWTWIVLENPGNAQNMSWNVTLTTLECSVCILVYICVFMARSGSPGVVSARFLEDSILF